MRLFVIGALTLGFIFAFACTTHKSPADDSATVLAISEAVGDDGQARAAVRRLGMRFLQADIAPVNTLEIRRVTEFALHDVIDDNDTRRAIEDALKPLWKQVGLSFPDVGEVLLSASGGRK